VVPSDDKRSARLNCISHILDSITYEDVVKDPAVLPEMDDVPHIRLPMNEQPFVPAKF
jgi:hypothetical protein